MFLHNNDFHLHFQLGSQNHDVDFIINSTEKKENIVFGGMGYSLYGENESTRIVSIYLTSLATNQGVSENRKELRVRLWQDGAQQISFSKEVDHIGQEILGVYHPFDIKSSTKRVCDLLEENYIFPDIAKRCSAYLRHELQQGAYDAISDPDTFAQVLTADLRFLSEDKHIEVKTKSSQDQFRPESEEAMSAYLMSISYGLGTYANFLSIGLVKELPEHLGYLEIHGFQAVHENDAEYEKFPDAVAKTKEAVDRAMQEIKLKKPKSIIIDLRNNGGGSPYGVQLLSSYFLPENTPLNTIRWRKKECIEIEERKTLSYDEIPEEKRLIDVSLFILTSQRTFSAGEEFANNMKALKRATIIGELTKGGANPGRSHQLNDSFEIFIPDGQSINPHNSSNWEGTGVIPDLFVPSDEALDLALSLG